MVISFPDEDDLQVETVSDRSDFDEEDEETASAAGSEASMSEFDGSPSELPPVCLFGPKECRSMFQLASDTPVFFRVCGNAQGVCKRPGHVLGSKAAVGYYEPIKARRYFDGKLNTFLSIEEFATREKERGEAKVVEMELASSILANRNESPSEDHKVAAKPSPVDLTASTRSTGNGYKASLTSKKLDDSGIASDAVDPATMMMFGMMDQMQKTMERMNEELTALKVTPSQGRTVVDSEATSEVKPVIPVKKESPLASKSKVYYYGVGHGRNGAYGVFQSWGEVHPLVIGTSKAVYKRFENYDEAQEFVDISQALRNQQIGDLPDGVPDSDERTILCISKLVGRGTTCDKRQRSFRAKILYVWRSPKLRRGT
jgi:hypothetical protein